MSSRAVLIAGYYGHRNLGDETILHVMLEELRRVVPGLGATVVSGRPEDTRAAHGVTAIHEQDVPAIIDAAQACDLVILGGGGLFHDYQGVDEATLLSRWQWGLTYYASFPLLATLFRKPLLIAAAGVGPLRSDAGRRYTRLTFDRADAAIVRDAASRAELAGLGLDAGRIHVTADPAWQLRVPERAEGRRALERLGVPAGSLALAVAVRHWDIGVKAAWWQAEVADALDTLVESHAAVPVFMPFQPADEPAPSDVAVAEQIRGQMKHGGRVLMAKPDLDPVHVQTLIAGADLMLAMRLHAVILAGNAGVPLVGLAYDPKVASAMDQLGQGERAIGLANASATSVAQHLQQVYVDRAGVTDRLKHAHADLRAAASRTWVVAAELLATRPPVVREPSAELTEVLHTTYARQVRRAEVNDAYVVRLTSDLAVEAQEVRRLTAAGAADVGTVADLTEQLAVMTRRHDEAARQAGALLVLVNRVSATRVWRFMTRYWRWRASIGPALRKRIHLLNFYEFAFDRFKRERQAAVGDQLAGLRTPGEPGLVSVVLPAFNGADLIREAIDSVLSQTYTRFELIIVNDGSTDDTPAIADAYARSDPRVRVVHQENRKLPRTLSEGVRHARGEFLTWTSCDNRMKPDCLARLVADLSARPACDMVYANLDIIDADGRFMQGAGQYDGYQRPPGSEHVHLPRRTAELNTWANNYVGAAFLYRRRVAWLLGDYSPFRFVCEDYDYWMRVNALLTLRHASFAEPVYEYRFHGGSLSARWHELGMLDNRERLMVFEEFRRDFCLAPMLWVVDGDDAGLTAELEARIAQAGQVLYRGQFPLDQLPGLWVPVVHLRTAVSPDAPGGLRADLPASALAVLVTRAGVLPASARPSWQMCVAVSRDAPLPELTQFAQGWFGAADAAQAFRAIDIRARAHHLAQIEALVEAPPPTALKASVVICTHRFGDRVMRAIKSVLDQSLPPDRYEVIVVNNAPGRPELAGAVQQLRDAHPHDKPDHLRLIACPILGLSAARNAGIAEARGELICLLDDDAVADPQWLERLCAAFDAHPEAGVIGGHIRLHIPTPRPASLKHGWEKYWSQMITGFSEYTEVRHWWEFPWGANWAARRATLLAIGGFRLRYGRVGDNFWGGEEVIAAALAQRLGWRIAILPEASVLHDVDPRRFTRSHVRRTLVAGHCVAYLGQRDLYIPMERGVRHTLRQIADTFFDRSVPGRTDRWLDAAFRKYAQVRLLLLQLGDLRRRLRRSVVDRDPPVSA